MKNKIQISQATADHLAAAGKTHWLKPREDAVQAKGKGVLTTFWLNPSSRVEASVTSDESDVLRETIPGQNNVSDINAAVNDKKKERLVDWMVELLLPQIKKIVSNAPRFQDKFQTSNLTSVECLLACPIGRRPRSYVEDKTNYGRYILRSSCWSDVFG